MALVSQPSGPARDVEVRAANGPSSDAAAAGGSAGTDITDDVYAARRVETSRPAPAQPGIDSAQGSDIDYGAGPTADCPPVTSVSQTECAKAESGMDLTSVSDTLGPSSSSENGDDCDKSTSNTDINSPTDQPYIADPQDPCACAKPGSEPPVAAPCGQIYEMDDDCDDVLSPGTDAVNAPTTIATGEAGGCCCGSKSGESNSSGNHGEDSSLQPLYLLTVPTGQQGRGYRSASA